jgi:hypothetical protein
MGVFPHRGFCPSHYQQSAGMQYLICMVLVFSAIKFFLNTAQNLAVPCLLEMSNLLSKYRVA